MGVVIVAPTSAAWPHRAIAAFGVARLHVARLPDRRALGALLARGGVRAILIDVASRGRSWAAERLNLQRLAPKARILVVRDDDLADEPDTIAWPHGADEALDVFAMLVPPE